MTSLKTDAREASAVSVYMANILATAYFYKLFWVYDN